jgi:hypothetical protein
MEHGHATSTELMSNIAFGMDFILTVMGVWMAVSVLQLKIGGAIRKSAINIVIASLVLGFAHAIETLMAKIGVESELNEIIHRGIIFIGFIWLMIGINKLLKAFNRD